MHGLFRVRGFTQARAFSSWSVDVVWHMAMQASGKSWEGVTKMIVVCCCDMVSLVCSALAPCGCVNAHFSRCCVLLSTVGVA